MDAARHAFAATPPADHARLEAIEASLAQAERARGDADARAEEAIEERDALVAQLDAAKRAVQAMQAAVDARLEVIDAKRNRTVQALKEARRVPSRPLRERDTLAARLEEALQSAAAPTWRPTRGWPRRRGAGRRRNGDSKREASSRRRPSGSALRLQIFGAIATPRIATSS